MSNYASTTLPGSWEALYQEARQAASNHNDEAIERYHKLIDRLGKMDPARRKAAGGRLQEIYRDSLFDLQSYLTMRGRYDEALEVITDIEAGVGGEDPMLWATHRARVLSIAGRQDEAVSVLESLIDDDAALEQRVNLALLHMRQQEFDQARATLDAAKAWLETDAESTDEERRSNQAYLALLYARLANEAGDFPEVVARFEEAVQLDPESKVGITDIYRNLVRKGGYEEATRLIRRDQKSPIRSNFWYGVLLYRRGETKLAQQQWEQITKLDLEKVQEPALVELIMTYYYLGDPEGAGLGSILEIIGEADSPSWIHFFLAGLGWAGRGNLRNAKSNFRLALDAYRSIALGAYLPDEAWFFCSDLLEEEALAEIADYFEAAHAA